MVETSHDSTIRTARTRSVTPADATLARTSGAPFWVLAFLLVLGIGIAIVLALRGLHGPGVFTQEQAFTATGMALFTIALVLLVFLGTIAYVFGEVRRLRSIGEVREVRRVEEVNRQEGVNRSMREEIAALRAREHVLLTELQKRRRLASGAHEGDPHVIEIEGIGPRYATRLNSLGIITVNQLVAADAMEVAQRIEATPEQVQEWQAMGRLLKVKGVGPQWAEALARCGVQGPEDLAQRNADTLAASIAELNQGKVRVTGSDPSPATVRRWIRAAGGQPVVSRRARRPATRRTVHAPRPATRVRSR